MREYVLVPTTWYRVECTALLKYRTVEWPSGRVVE